MIWRLKPRCPEGPGPCPPLQLHPGLSAMLTPRGHRALPLCRHTQPLPISGLRSADPSTWNAPPEEPSTATPLKKAQQPLRLTPPPPLRLLHRPVALPRCPVCSLPLGHGLSPAQGQCYSRAVRPYGATPLTADSQHRALGPAPSRCFRNVWGANECGETGKRTRKQKGLRACLLSVLGGEAWRSQHHVLRG